MYGRYRYSTGSVSLLAFFCAVFGFFWHLGISRLGAANPWPIQFQPHPRALVALDHPNLNSTSHHAETKANALR